jgi:hypothetical protein
MRPALPAAAREPNATVSDCPRANVNCKEGAMGRGILLWLLGVPIPIIILILLFWH